MASIQKEQTKQGTRYRVRWIEVDDDGKKRHPSETFNTREAAKKRKAQIEAANSRDAVVMGTRAQQTLTEWMVFWWKTWMVTRDEATRRNYQSSMVNHIVPRLGAVQLHELASTPSTLQRWHNALRNDGVGEPTIRYATAVLSSSLGRAYKDGIIPINPCSRLDWGSQETRQFVRAADPAFFEAVRQRLLSAELRKGAPAWVRARDAAYSSVLYQAFLRPQEANALQWRHIDFDGEQILIEQAMKPGQLGTTKTKTKRPAPMFATLTADLEAFKLESQSVSRRNRAATSHADPEDFVFPGKAGGPPRTLNSYRTWRRTTWRPAVADVVAAHPEWADFAEARPYLGRHSGISLALLEFDYRSVASWAGHSPQTLLKHYAHFIQAHRKRSYSVEELLAEARRDPDHATVPELADVVAEIMPGEDAAEDLADAA
ncbi:MAG: traSA:integrase fusion protein [Conexibacter sp.]|nr:traSA:integrase fusion protein [Conexibacter sp.]